MKKNRDLNLVTADPQICHGQPIVRGTRVMVWQILELLESGKKEQEIAQAFPNLPQGAISAVLHYAAERAKGTTYLEFKTRVTQSDPSPVFA